VSDVVPQFGDALPEYTKVIMNSANKVPTTTKLIAVSTYASEKLIFKDSHEVRSNLSISVQSIGVRAVLLKPSFLGLRHKPLEMVLVLDVDLCLGNFSNNLWLRENAHALCRRVWMLEKRSGAVAKDYYVVLTFHKDHPQHSEQLHAIAHDDDKEESATELDPACCAQPFGVEVRDVRKFGRVFVAHLSPLLMVQPVHSDPFSGSGV
jgi:hypothetical protein